MDTKKLRQKILDLAIHGKLVPQDPNDEPASVLLERIRAEKERLIKEGKIKQSKKSAKSSDTPHYENRQVGEANEVPFEVPESWEWQKLGDIGVWQSGATPSRLNKEYYVGNIPWLKTGDLNDGYIQEIPETITQKALEETSVKLNPAGSVLIAMYGATIGKVGILTFPATTNQACCACVEYNGIEQMYLFYFLLSHKEEFIMLGGGGAQPNISKERIVDTYIPIPPQFEQKRIINAIEQWFALIDTLESAKEDLQMSIAQAKSKILGLAIHGKLLPQDPNDEPAIELLKRINPKFTPCDNAHYENVPSNWIVCKVKEVFRINPKTKADDDMKAGFVPMSNIQDSFKNSITFEPKTWESIKKGYTHFEDGDIAVAKISPCLENRKSAVIVGLPNGIGAGTTELNVFRSDYIHPLYGLFFFKSDYFISQCVGTFNGVVGQQRVSTKIIEDMVFPVPPRPEQERIINKVNELFQILDNISVEL